MGVAMRRVLIVEDDYATMRALRGLFRAKGWDVETAGTIAEGLAALVPPPDCIVLDLMLPDGNGEEILQKVVEDGLPTCVAVCSGVGDPDRLRRVRALGPKALLRKPVEIADVLAACGSQA